MSNTKAVTKSIVGKAVATKAVATKAKAKPQQAKAATKAKPQQAKAVVQETVAEVKGGLTFEKEITLRIGAGNYTVEELKAELSVKIHRMSLHALIGQTVAALEAIAGTIKAETDQDMIAPTVKDLFDALLESAGTYDYLFDAPEAEGETETETETETPEPIAPVAPVAGKPTKTAKARASV